MADQSPHVRECATCAHHRVPVLDEPCKSCTNFDNWMEPMPLAPPSRGETTFAEQADACILTNHLAPGKQDAADILESMAFTFRERNKTYGSNYKMVGPLIKVLFPDGVPSWLVETHRWHLFELMLVKLSRFAISELRHEDSIHDAGVYAAMIESILLNKEDTL